MLVLDTPDRHTSDAESWSALASAHAKRGLAVAVLTATTPLIALAEPPAPRVRRENPENADVPHTLRNSRYDQHPDRP
jgi:hypothetical protein